MGPLAAPDNWHTRLAWDAASSGMGWYVIGLLVLGLLVWTFWR